MKIQLRTTQTMLLYFICFFIYTAGADPCLQEGVTWDHTDILQLVPGVESVELCKEECVGVDADQCHAFTWNMHEDPHFPKLCYLFRKMSAEMPEVQCEYCVSGPKDCLCSHPGSCDIIEDNFVGYQAGVETEIECHGLCSEAEGCNFYTWFDMTSHPFLFDCFLYSSCESTDNSCIGCVSGPLECTVTTAISTDLSTTDPVTDTTTVTETTTVTDTTPVTETSPATETTPTTETTPVSETTPATDTTPTTETTPVTETTPITTTPIVTETTPSSPTSTPDPVSCEVPTDPIAGNWNCEPHGPILTCNLRCPQGYFSSSWELPSNCSAGEWSVEPGEVKCEEGLALVVGGDESEKSVELFGTGYHEIVGFGLPDEKKHHTTDFVTGQILTCGGGSFTTEQRSCLSLDRLGSWHGHSQLSDVRYGHSSLTIADSLILVGGYIPHARTSTEFYNMTEDQGWTQSPYLKEQLYKGCGVVVTDTQFILIGGDKAEKKVIRYEAFDGTFKEEEDLNIGRTGHGCLTIRTGDREGVLVVGGYNQETMERLTSTEFFNFKTHSWSEVGDLQIPRSGLGLVQIGETVLAMGGKYEGDFVENVQSVEKLDLSSWTWSVAEEMLEPRSFQSVTLIPANYFVE